MTMQSPPPATPLIPESAPFSQEQRAWLNGFFAGLLSLDAGASVAPASSDSSPAKKPLSQARCSWLKGADSGMSGVAGGGDCMVMPVSYTHLRAHETDSYLVCRLLLEKKKNR